MSRCKRRPSVQRSPIGAGDTVTITLPLGIVEYTLRVVDATSFAGVAATFAYGASPSALFHLGAGESFVEERIGPLADPLVLLVGAAVAAVAELQIWED